MDGRGGNGRAKHVRGGSVAERCGRGGVEVSGRVFVDWRRTRGGEEEDEAGGVGGGRGTWGWGGGGDRRFVQWEGGTGWVSGASGFDRGKEEFVRDGGRGGQVSRVEMEQ